MESRGQGEGHRLHSSRGKEEQGEVAERHSGRRATQKDLRVTGLASGG